MRYSKISPDSDITLRSESGNTPDKAINEAIEFVKEHGLKSVDLNYGGFTMYIDPDVAFLVWPRHVVAVRLIIRASQSSSDCGARLFKINGVDVHLRWLSLSKP